MPGSTRRNFIKAGSAGVAVVGVASIAAPAASAAPARPQPLKPAKNAPSLVAHVDDAASGKITLLVGHREVVVHDLDLVARLTRAAEGK